MSTQTLAPAPRYASMGRRTSAVLLNHAILVVVAMVNLTIVGLTSRGTGESTFSLDARGVLVLVVTQSVIGALQWWLVATRGQTLGHWLLRMWILDQRTLKPLGWRRSFLRGAVFEILKAPWLWPLLAVMAVTTQRHPRHQAWHDRTVGAVVMWSLVEPRRAALAAAWAERRVTEGAGLGA